MESTSYLKEGAGYLTEGISYLKEGTSYLTEGTSFLKEGTSYLTECTSYLMEGTSYLKEVPLLILFLLCVILRHCHPGIIVVIQSSQPPGRQDNSF